MTADDDFRSWVLAEHPEHADAIKDLPIATLLTLYPDVTPSGERYELIKKAAHAILTRRSRSLPARRTSMKKFAEWIERYGNYRIRSVDTRVVDNPTTVDELVWNTLAKEPYRLPMKQFNAKISNNFFYGAYYYVTQGWDAPTRDVDATSLKGFRLVSGDHGVNIPKHS